MKWFVFVVFLLSWQTSVAFDFEEAGLVTPELNTSPSAPMVQCPNGQYFQQHPDGRCVPMQWVMPSAPSSPKPLVQNENCFQIKGVASLEGVDKAFARKMAIRNALEEAVMRRGLKVSSNQEVENFALVRQSGRFTAKSKVKSFEILREDLVDELFIAEELEQEQAPAEEDLGRLPTAVDEPEPELPSKQFYEVILSVCLTEDENACPNLESERYSPRLAIAPLAVAHPDEVRDISNVLNGYRLELNRRLRQLDLKNVVLMDEAIDLQPNIQVTPNLDLQLLESVRNQTGAQFMLLSVLRSAGAFREDKGVWSQTKRYYNIQVPEDSRYIEVDWYVVNLTDFSIIHENRTGFDVKGDVYVGRNRPFGSNAFFATDTGMVFNTVLNQQSMDVQKFMRCQPFETEVIDIREGEYYLSLSADSGVQVGDDLAVYHRVGRGVQFNGRNLGSDYKPGAFLRIKRVMPRFAVAEISAQKDVVQIGDRVKAW